MDRVRVSTLSDRTERIIGYFTYFMIGLFFTTLTALLIWALIRYGQEPPNVALCTGRNLAQGFIGNSDFYGLGIRLGVYIQWITQISANVLMPGERRSAAATGIVFLFALLIATQLAIFQHQCTYTVEIVVVQWIFWPGVLIMALPFLASMATSHKYIGITYGYLVAFYPMLTSTFWFWIRLATVGEKDFVPTPGGTAFFAFAKVTGSSLHRVSVAFAVLWGWIAFFNVLGIFINDQRTGFLKRINVWVQVFNPMFLLSFTAGIFGWVYWFFDRYLMRDQELRQSVQDFLDSEDSNDLPPLVHEYLTFAGSSVLSIFIIIWSICAIELTLKWNKTAGIYVVNSTGQIIPLVVSLGTLFALGWHTWLRPFLEPMEDKERMEEAEDLEAGEQAVLSTSFQQPDGTWRGYARVNAKSNDDEIEHNSLALAEQLPLRVIRRLTAKSELLPRASTA